MINFFNGQNEKKTRSVKAPGLFSFGPVQPLVASSIYGQQQGLVVLCNRLFGVFVVLLFMKYYLQSSL